MIFTLDFITVMVTNHAMTLAVFLADRKISLTEFARRIGSTTESVRRYRNHDHIPTREMMLRIFEETDGLVTPNDFYGVGPVPARPHTHEGDQ